MFERITEYFFQLIVWADQGANVLLGGTADETLSSRAHRMREKKHRVWGWTANAIDALFFWQKAHCKSAYESELKRLHFSKAFRLSQ